MLISWWKHSHAAEVYFLRSLVALSKAYPRVDIQVVSHIFLAYYLKYQLVLTASSAWTFIGIKSIQALKYVLKLIIFTSLYTSAKPVCDDL